MYIYFVFVIVLLFNLFYCGWCCCLLVVRFKTSYKNIDRLLILLRCAYNNQVFLYSKHNNNVIFIFKQIFTIKLLIFFLQYKNNMFIQSKKLCDLWLYSCAHRGDSHLFMFWLNFWLFFRMRSFCVIPSFSWLEKNELSFFN